MRSEGQVRFITISSRFQMTAAGIAAAALLAWGGSMGAMTWTQYRASADRASLIEREVQVASSEERLNLYRENIDQVAEDLERRQDVIEDMVASIPADLKAEVSASETETQSTETVEKVSAAIPEAASLARIEARQLAFVETLTRFADRRAERAASALRKLGLNPDSVLRNADRQAMGGPLERIATGPNGEIDPRFERLGQSIARMSALENSLDGVPQVRPTSTSLSSGFGYRRDPFTRRGAMHKGLDFKGARGTPIAAAARGRVSFVGWKSGYGKTVEIQHGNGLMTRYAHLSAFSVQRGQKVDAGTRIAAMGSTGRSTGPHLHFEVRIHGRAVNPRTFLETAPNVLKEVRRAPELAQRQSGETDGQS